MLAHPESTDNKAKKEENIFKHAWHSVEEALHLRSETPEDVPPPVPPKDDRWVVKTIDKSTLNQPDPSFWDKLFRSQQESQQEEEVAVSISVPADAALKCLGVEGDDKDLLEKQNYFKRMAARVKEKFDEDDDDSDSDSDSDSDLDSNGKDKDKKAKTEQEKLESKQRKRLAPKVDPKEMREAHRAIYGESAVDPKADEESDKKLFGAWWGCHPRRSRAERKLAKQQEAEREQQRVLADLEAKRKIAQEAAEAVAKAEEDAARAAAKAAGKKWWHFSSSETPEHKAKEANEAKEKERQRGKKEKKHSSRKHQAIAAAAAYEAMKKYQEHQEKGGKDVSHAEMKAVLAGIAMAECVKLFDARHDDDDDDDSKDDTVAEAGSKVLKLFELMNKN